MRQFLICAFRIGTLVLFGVSQWSHAFKGAAEDLRQHTDPTYKWLGRLDEIPWCKAILNASYTVPQVTNRCSYQPLTACEIGWATCTGMISIKLTPKSTHRNGLGVKLSTPSPRVGRQSPSMGAHFQRPNQSCQCSSTVAGGWLLATGRRSPSTLQEHPSKS